MNSTIYTNMDSVRNYNVFNKNASNASRAMERATTGLKIASAKDNASQYAISAKMLERINSNTQASQNVQNDNALLKTAEGGIGNTIDILQTLKARAIDAANDSNTDADRANIQKEVDKLIAQIDTNATNVKYNGKALLDGTYAESVTSSTQATAFVALDATTADKKLSQYFSGLTASGGAVAYASWVDANGKAQAQAKGGFTVNSKFSEILTGLGLSGITIASVAADNQIGGSVTDKNGDAVKATTAGYGAYATTAGKDNSFSSLSVTIDAGKGNTRTFTFDEIQTGKDVNSDTAQSLTFQVGEEKGFTIDDVNIEDMGSSGLGVGALNVSTQSTANTAIQTIDTALKRALAQQTDIGALEQRLGFTADTLDTINENLQASASAIRDADMAKEISTYMKWNVLMQASQYMLAQSNQNAYSALNLLQ